MLKPELVGGCGTAPVLGPSSGRPFRGLSEEDAGESDDK
jgi:hypothetical protein